MTQYINAFNPKRSNCRIETFTYILDDGSTVTKKMIVMNQ